MGIIYRHSIIIAHDQLKYLHMYNHIPAIERVVAEVVRIVVREVNGITMSSAVEFMLCSGKLLLKSLLFNEMVPSNN